MLIFMTLSPVVKKDRSPVSPDPFTALEKNVSDTIVTLLDGYQNIRDHFDETMFFTIYENPLMRLLFPETSRKKKPDKELAFTYQNDITGKYVISLFQSVGSQFYEVLDITDDEKIKAVFAELKTHFHGGLDFIVHGIARGPQQRRAC